MMIWGNGMGGWTMTLVTLGNLLFWGLLITGIVLLVRRPNRDTAALGPAIAAAAPQQVLADRFARGEIDEDEYRCRLQVLTDVTLARPGG
jgi:putative membrane protein